MTRPRLALFLTGAVMALILSWAIPRLQAPQDRFTVAMSLIDDGRGADAVHLLEDRVWRGIAEYRANRFRRAAAEFIQEEGVTPLYNLGTTYARLGEWSASRAAYERVLSLDPGHEDAAFNLALVLQAEDRQRQDQEGQRQTRTLGAEKGDPGQGSQQDTGTGEQTTTDDARPSEDAAATDKQASRSGQIAHQGRTGEEALTDDAAAGRGNVSESGERDASGQQGAGGMRLLTESSQNVEVLLRALKDDPERVLAARLRAIHRQRQQVAQ